MLDVMNEYEMLKYFHFIMLINKPCKHSACRFIWSEVPLSLVSFITYQKECFMDFFFFFS